MVVPDVITSSTNTNRRGAARLRCTARERTCTARVGRSLLPALFGIAVCRMSSGTTSAPKPSRSNSSHTRRAGHTVFGLVKLERGTGTSTGLPSKPTRAREPRRAIDRAMTARTIGVRLTGSTASVLIFSTRFLTRLAWSLVDRGA